MAWNDIFTNLKKPLPPWLTKTANRLTAEGPMVYWYPCSGVDLTPLVIDTPEGIDGWRLFPQAGKNGPLVLWINDHDERIGSVFEILTATDEPFPGKGSLEESCGKYNTAVIPIEGEYYHTRLKVLKDYPTDSDSIPIEFFNAKIIDGVFSKSKCRPDEGDTYLVIFSNTDTRNLFRQVFLRMGIQIKVAAIINPGWTEPPNGPTNHYEIVPQILAFNQALYGNNPLLLADERKPLWGQHPFEKTAHKYKWTRVNVSMWRLAEYNGICRHQTDDIWMHQWMQNPENTSNKSSICD